MVSIPRHPDDTSVAAVLSSIEGHYDLVYAYDVSDEDDPWKRFDPSVPPFANDLLDIDETKGLLISATDAVTWWWPDSTAPSGRLSLQPGWNLVGYPSPRVQPVADALASIDGKYTVVYSYDASDADDPWKVYDPAAPLEGSDLTQMMPGHGYWILATEACEWNLEGEAYPSR